MKEYTFELTKLPRYKKFIMNRSFRTLTADEAVERHHIQPRGLGGKNDTANIIILSVREHFIAHLLLYQETQHPKMIYAFWQMIGRAQLNYPGSLKKYARYRIEVRKDMAKMSAQVMGKIMKKGKILYNHTTHEAAYILNTQVAEYKLNGWVSNIRPISSRILHKDNLIVLAASDEFEFGYGEDHKIHKKLKGQVVLHRGVKHIRVRPDQVSNKEVEGWVRGYSKSFRDRFGKKGQRWKNVWIDPTITERAPLDCVAEYVARGYHIGTAPQSKNVGYHWTHKEKTKKRMSKSHRGLMDGWKHYYKDDKLTFAHPSEWAQLEADGWLPGAPQCAHEPHCKQMHDGVRNRFVPVDQVEARWAEGWTSGWRKSN